MRQNMTYCMNAKLLLSRQNFLPTVQLAVLSPEHTSLWPFVLTPDGHHTRQTPAAVSSHSGHPNFSHIHTHTRHTVSCCMATVIQLQYWFSNVYTIVPHHAWGHLFIMATKYTYTQSDTQHILVFKYKSIRAIARFSWHTDEIVHLHRATKRTYASWITLLSDNEMTRSEQQETIQYTHTHTHNLLQQHRHCGAAVQMPIEQWRTQVHKYTPRSWTSKQSGPVSRHYWFYFQCYVDGDHCHKYTEYTRRRPHAGHQRIFKELNKKKTKRHKKNRE